MCTGDDAAVYCGTSAGAIIMGASMDTACWKVGADRAVNGILRACMILTSCHLDGFHFDGRGGMILQLCPAEKIMLIGRT